MVLWAQTLRKSYGPLFFATIHTGDYRTKIDQYRKAMTDSLGYLPDGCPGNPKGFYEVLLATSFHSGVQNLLQLTGMGSVRPNVYVMGFKEKWQKDSIQVIDEYVSIMRDTLKMNFSMIICVGIHNINWTLTQFSPPARRQTEDGDITIEGFEILTPTKQTTNETETENNDNNNEIIKQTQTNLDIQESNNWFKGQQQATFIDIWYLIDDGGFTLLLPNIIQKHAFWSKCQLRLNTIVNENSLQYAAIKLENIIKNFRLNYTQPRTILIKDDNPSPKMIKKFEKLSGQNINNIARNDTLKRWLKLCEAMYKYSKYCGLNIVTFPMPFNQIKSKSYMALLHLMSDSERLPPTLLVRGNGENVLTFYSE